TSQWVQFFTGSGLPSDVCVRYAVIFSENRIQRGMLLDLTKEYLFDMGIHAMGDVIAILKHAKHVHSQEAQEKVMNSASATAKLAVGIPSRYTRKVLDQPQVPTARVSFQDPRDQTDDRGGAVVRPVAKRRSVEEPSASVAKQQRGAGWGVAAPPRVAASRVAPVVAPAPVAPPTEGPTLKVHLPSGPRAQQLLEKAQGSLGIPVGKRSVFARLGDSAVSSTTDLAPSKVAVGSSVFGRLGPSTEEVQAPSLARKGLPLAFRGVLAAAAAASRSQAPSTGRVIKLTGSPASSHLPSRRQVIAPSSTARSPRLQSAVGCPGGLMLRKSLSDATSSSRMSARFSPTSGSTPVAGVRYRLGPQASTRTVRTPAAATVRTVARPTMVATSRQTARLVPTSSRAALARSGISGSSAAPRNVFTRLGNGASAF
ncbi:unnamed protein product, partial [Ixodes hexagonus]